MVASLERTSKSGLPFRYSYSCGVTSDNLNHDKYATTMFIEDIIDDLQTKVTTPDRGWRSSMLVCHNISSRSTFSFASSVCCSIMASKSASISSLLTMTMELAVDGVGGMMKRTVFRCVHASTHHHSFKYRAVS